MQCDQCGERDAVVHVTQIVDNAVTQLRLCEKCAASKGIETTVGAPSHVLAGVLQAAHEQLATSSDAPRCAFCGMTQGDLKAGGRLGCAHCYGAFAESLRELLRRVHGNSRHQGRRYVQRVPDHPELPRSIEVLRERLREAIEREQFEAAAALRDEIRGLE